MKVAVLMGGRSAEKSISILSGRNVAHALRQLGHEVKEIQIGKDTLFLRDMLKKEKPKVCFVALHGPFGEDGTVQGTLELMGIPYTGSGVLSSALAMNKHMSKLLFKILDIPTPEFFMVHKNEKTPQVVKKIEGFFGFPVVVKPVNQGSTIGVSLVQSKTRLGRALKEAVFFSANVLVEQHISGKEITVSVLGTGQHAFALPPIEIQYQTRDHLYNFEAKYRGKSKHVIPPEISGKDLERVKNAALQAHRGLGCRSFSRTDIIVSEGVPYVLEVNTIPGLTSMSLFPEAARSAGIEFPALVEGLVRDALQNGGKDCP